MQGGDEGLSATLSHSRLCRPGPYNLSATTHITQHTHFRPQQVPTTSPHPHPHINPRRLAGWGACPDCGFPGS